MIVFWIAAAVFAALCAGLILHRAARAAGGLPADPSVAVYRRALGEIEDLAGRGLLVGDDLRASRAEAGRRLLGAAETPAAQSLARLSRNRLFAISAAAPLIAFGAYFAVGSPGAADQPFAGRLLQWRTHPEAYSEPELLAALRSVAEEHPTNPDPFRVLAAKNLAAGDPNGALHALRKADLASPNNPDILGPMAEIMVLKAGGTVDAQAAEMFQKLLAAQPGSPTARYFLARRRIASGDTAGGLAAWRGLLTDLAANDRRRVGLLQDIATVEKTGALAAPEAAAAAAPGATQNAIMGMVHGLAARLKANPDDPAGWVRLVRAYTVLGDTFMRDKTLAAAKARYADRPEILNQLRDALNPPR